MSKEAIVICIEDCNGFMECGVVECDVGGYDNVVYTRSKRYNFKKGMCYYMVDFDNKLSLYQIDSNGEYRGVPITEEELKEKLKDNRYNLDNWRRNVERPRSFLYDYDYQFFLDFEKELKEEFECVTDVSYSIKGTWDSIVSENDDDTSGKKFKVIKSC